MILKCKMCGGDLRILEGQTVCECEYCGTRQTVPALDSEKKVTLFSRANRLRIAGEFDRAYSVYESIVADFPQEAEAYWGLVLCKYGIEYVDDPKTGKKIPTCHRSSFDCVLDDEDYVQTLVKADIVSRIEYQAEAEEIERIRADIVELSALEDPYDIFICYKETDENGERTVDSLIAQDVWSALTEKGYRVFFARISLEDKLGQEYEPYIFAALNSARIMLAFGTSYDNYQAVWVKNEWSRYLALMAKGAKKALIPCYKDMDPYDLPREFRRLQAQDMGKVGAIQDLLRGIRKILGDSASKAEVIVAAQGQQGIAAPLLKRAFHFLEEEDWPKANEYFEKALDFDYENGEAYLGKLMAELQVSQREQLKAQPVPFDDRESYQNAIRYGDEKLKQELAAYLAAIRVRIETQRKEAIYQKALGLMADGQPSEAKALFAEITTYKDSLEKIALCEQQAEAARKERAYQQALALIGRAEYAEAEQIFSGIDGYKDAAIHGAECRKQAEIARKNAVYSAAVAASKIKTVAKQEEAAALFQTIPGWKNADEQREQCEQRASVLRTKKPRRTEQKAQKTANKGIKVWDLAIIVAVSAIVLISLIAHKHMRYTQAMALVEARRYAEAVPVLGSLDGYRDSATAYRYAQASLLMDEGQYDAAISIFDSLGQYADSEEKSAACVESIRLANEKKAEELAVYLEKLAVVTKAYDDRNYSEAINGFTDLQSFLDSAALLQKEDVTDTYIEAKYLYATSLLLQEEYEAALQVFSELGNFKDSAEKAASVEAQIYSLTDQGRYEKAKALEAEGNYASAANAYDSLRDYLDSRHRKQLCWMQDAAGSGNSESLFNVDVELLTEEESAEYRRICYASAENRVKAQDYKSAFALYQISQIGDFQDRMAACNEQYIATHRIVKTCNGRFFRDVQYQKIGETVFFIISLNETRGEIAKHTHTSHSECRFEAQNFNNPAVYNLFSIMLLDKNDARTTIEFHVPFSKLKQYPYRDLFLFWEDEVKPIGGNSSTFSINFDSVVFKDGDFVFKDLYGGEY